MRHVGGELQLFEDFEEMTANGRSTGNHEKSLKLLGSNAEGAEPPVFFSSLAFSLLSYRVVFESVHY